MTAMVSIRAPDDDINKILAAQKKVFVFINKRLLNNMFVI